MVYENLPPVIFSPLATLFLEKNLNRAWHVSQNRMLITVSTKHHSLKEIIQTWLIVSRIMANEYWIIFCFIY